MLNSTFKMLLLACMVATTSAEEELADNYFDTLNDFEKEAWLLEAEENAEEQLRIEAEWDIAKGNELLEFNTDKEKLVMELTEGGYQFVFVMAAFLIVVLLIGYGCYREKKKKAKEQEAIDAQEEIDEQTVIDDAGVAEDLRREEAEALREDVEEAPRIHREATPDRPGAQNLRRLASRPFARLAGDLGIELEPSPRRLADSPAPAEHADPDLFDKILSMDGFEYYLGFSCFMQLELVWIGLGYYLYRRCTQKRTQAKREALLS